MLLVAEQDDGKLNIYVVWRGGFGGKLGFVPMPTEAKVRGGHVAQWIGFLCSMSMSLGMVAHNSKSALWR